MKTTLLVSIALAAMLAGSPALDKRNNATCLSKDQRGVARPQGAKCDLGAYEYVP